MTHLYRTANKDFHKDMTFLNIKDGQYSFQSTKKILVHTGKSGKDCVRLISNRPFNLPLKQDLEMKMVCLKSFSNKKNQSYYYVFNCI